MKKLTRGTSSRGERVFPHEKHPERSRRVRPVLKRYIITLKKLPKTSPKRKKSERKKYSDINALHNITSSAGKIQKPANRRIFVNTIPNRPLRTHCRSEERRVG